MQEERRQAIYRLVGGAPKGADVIAKRCPRDEAEEAVIMEVIQQLMTGRTTFTIAHGVNTLQRCAARLEVGGGRVAAVAAAGASPAGAR